MRILNWIALVISALAISLVVYIYINQPQIVYVRNGDVLQKYIGLKEANAIYEKKLADGQVKMDTIIMEYQAKVSEYELLKNGLSKNNRLQKESQLREEAQRISNFQEASKEELEKEHEQLLTGVLNQVNAYAELYAREKGFDMIIGTTSSGNLMFGKEKLDVTDDFIKRLNDYYKTGL